MKQLCEDVSEDPAPPVMCSMCAEPFKDRSIEAVMEHYNERHFRAFPDLEQLAKIGFAAYRQSMMAQDPEHCSMMFQWDDLRDSMRKGWLAAITAILTTLRGEHDEAV